MIKKTEYKHNYLEFDVQVTVRRDKVPRFHDNGTG